MVTLHCTDGTTTNTTTAIPPYQYWQVWKAATKLEKNGISSPSKEQYRSTTVQVVNILRQWGDMWAGHSAWKSVLNKTSLEHEVEESIVALYHLHEWLQSRVERDCITVVDLCCGKGLFSMLLSYMVGLYWNDCGISNIVLLDKAVAIDWHHIHAANENAAHENRPHLDLWKGVNLHKYDPLLDRLLGLNTPLALVGIHLCKTLSPSAVSLVHGLGRSICPYFCLAPCCVPRVVTSKYMTAERRQIAIYQYESPDERSQRLNSMAQRDRAMGRDRRSLCYICKTEGHRVRDCTTLEKLCDSDRRQRLRDAARWIPCWQCGNVGHFKADCPSGTSALVRVEPPTRYWDIESVLTSSQPFEQYCQVLAESLQSELSTVVVHDTGLENDKQSRGLVAVHHNDVADDHDGTENEFSCWNQGRKGIYIVAAVQPNATVMSVR
jgi:Methyltransferase domain/Zinc knuckle